MSMTTTLKDKQSGKILSFTTQQYEVGLYLAIYTKGEAIPQQTGLNIDEIKFHKKLRKDNPKFIKDESDPLNRKEVLAEKMVFVKQYCTKKKWPMIETPRGVMLSENGKISDRRAKVVRSQPEWAACDTKLEW